MKILHAFTGSVATRLHDKFAIGYKNFDHSVEYIATNSAKNFIDPNFPYDTDIGEWISYRMDEEVLHIELRNWADALVIAPCSMNTLAKIANGICDNLVTCVARAWDFSKPFIIAPSANTFMWNHPITQEHLDKVQKWGIKVIMPVEKQLYCGEVGIGGLADIREILKTLEND